MAKEQKHATLLCVIFSVWMVVCVLIAALSALPLIALVGLLPAVVYEVYRVEGVDTRFAAIGMLLILLAEAVLIIMNINIDLAALAGKVSAVQAYGIPLGDVRNVAPVIIALLAVMLIKRTGGRYTIWLAVVILIGSIGLLYSLNPGYVKELFGSGIVQEGLRRLR